MPVVRGGARRRATCLARRCAAWPSRDGIASRDPFPFPASRAGRCREFVSTKYGASCVGSAENEVYSAREFLPLRTLSGELFAAGARDGVVARLAVVLGGVPLGRNPSARDEAVQRRVERALVHTQQPVGAALDQLGDAPTVHGAQLENLEDEHLERAFNDFDAAVLGHGAPSLLSFRLG